MHVCCLSNMLIQRTRRGSLIFNMSGKISSLYYSINSCHLGDRRRLYNLNNHNSPFSFAIHANVAHLRIIISRPSEFKLSNFSTEKSGQLVCVPLDNRDAAQWQHPLSIISNCKFKTPLVSKWFGLVGLLQCFAFFSYTPSGLIPSLLMLSVVGPMWVVLLVLLVYFLEGALFASIISSL